MLPDRPPARRQQGRRATPPDEGNDTMTTYSLHKIQDPRTPGFFWYEIEATTDGQTETVAVCDTNEEARDTLRAMEGAIR